MSRRGGERAGDVARRRFARPARVRAVLARCRGVPRIFRELFQRLPSRDGRRRARSRDSDESITEVYHATVRPEPGYSPSRSGDPPPLPSFWLPVPGFRLFSPARSPHLIGRVPSLRAHRFSPKFRDCFAHGFPFPGNQYGLKRLSRILTVLSSRGRNDFRTSIRRVLMRFPSEFFFPSRIYSLTSLHTPSRGPPATDFPPPPRPGKLFSREFAKFPLLADFATNFPRYSAFT